MKTINQHLYNSFSLRVFLAGLRTALAITLLVQLVAFQAKAGIISASVSVEQGGQGIVFDSEQNYFAGAGDTVRAEASYVISNCPLCTDGGIKGTTQASLVTSSGSVSASGNYLFAGHPNDGTVTSGFSQSARFFIEDITISYRGIDEKARDLTSVFADLHMTADALFVGNSLGIDISARMNGDVKLKTLPTGIFNDQLVNFQNYTLPVGQLFSMDVFASTNTRSIFDELRNAHVASANWSLVLGGSPAFILPEGFYANSADGTIVDNFFVSANPPQAVSVPPLWFLITTGMCWLFLSRKK